MMNILRRGLLAMPAVAALAILAPVAVHAQTSPAKNKIVLQVSDGDSQKWSLTLNNARNVQEALGAKDVELEIVAYGPGIGMLKDDSVVGGRVADALKNGIKVVACEATMKAMKLGHADMLPDIGYVPFGAVELMKKQQEGYAYIRP